MHMHMLQLACESVGGSGLPRSLISHIPENELTGEARAASNHMLVRELEQYKKSSKKIVWILDKKGSAFWKW